MMPPNCCLCGRGLQTNEKCDLVEFAKAPGYDEEMERIRLKSPQGIVPGDHPDYMGWFCPGHAESAQELVSLEIDEALEKLRSHESRWPEDIPWTLKEMDHFDHFAAVELSGHGIERGIEELWAHILWLSNEKGDTGYLDYFLVWEIPSDSDCWDRAGGPHKEKGKALATLAEWANPSGQKRQFAGLSKGGQVLVRAIAQAHTRLIQKRAPSPGTGSEEADVILRVVGMSSDPESLKGLLAPVGWAA